VILCIYFYNIIFHGEIFYILDSILLAKSLQSSGKFWTVSSKGRSSAFPVQNPYVEWIGNTYTADYYKFGIFMDYDCNSSKEAFKEVNKRNSCFCVHTFIERTVALSFKPDVQKNFFIKKIQLTIFFNIIPMPYFVTNT
jgi:hypothetical protein